ncbi:MAG: hypothetical protein B7Y99_03125 [Caulobacterales bacterium 32-69-10]|nr:MAG: hypothetical protein B7Y99_03125 [Caulobacterales bacterium 32-69-10]
MEKPADADGFVLRQLIVDDGAKAEFTAELKGFDPGLAGRKFRLQIGATTVMSLGVPSNWKGAPLKFGPTRLDKNQLLALNSYELAAIDEAAPDLRLPISEIHGDLLEALALPTKELFFEKAQLHHSRYKSPELLTLAARSAATRFADNMIVRASALTILAHRILEKNLTTLTEQDHATIAWILGKAPRAIKEGVALIESGGDNPSWEAVRWTVSLATVAGHLALIRNDLPLAFKCYAAIPPASCMACLVM